MNKSFILFDKNNNVQKNADVIVKFNLDGSDYLVYSVGENEHNSQIFVSKLILNSEGKYFVDNILPEEKGKLNNVVYNILILVPSEVQKGNTFDLLSKDLSEKFSVKLSLDIPNLDVQEYYSNCSVAITSKILVDAAVKLYAENLNVISNNNTVVVPTWTAPVEVTAPTPADISSNVNVNPTVIAEPLVTSQPVQESIPSPELNVQSVSQIESVVNTVPEQIVPQPTVTAPAPVVNPVSTENVVMPNPQVEKLAVVSDPSLGIGVQQPNFVKNKKAGFANTKYIVIGSCCLVFALAIVITAFVLISNM